MKSQHRLVELTLGFGQEISCFFFSCRNLIRERSAWCSGATKDVDRLSRNIFLKVIKADIVRVKARKQFFEFQNGMSREMSLEKEYEKLDRRYNSKVFVKENVTSSF